MSQEPRAGAKKSVHMPAFLLPQLLPSEPTSPRSIDDVALAKSLPESANGAGFNSVRLTRPL